METLKSRAYDRHDRAQVHAIALERRLPPRAPYVPDEHLEEAKEIKSVCAAHSTCSVADVRFLTGGSKVTEPWFTTAST